MINLFQSVRHLFQSCHGVLSDGSQVADMQRIDMGIAMCHFALTAEELDLRGTWTVQESDIAKPDALTEYIASWKES